MDQDIEEDIAAANRRRGFSRHRQGPASAGTALAVIFGLALLCGSGWLLYYVSALNSDNSALRSIAGAAEVRARGDQAKRLLDHVGEANARTVIRNDPLATEGKLSKPDLPPPPTPPPVEVKTVALPPPVAPVKIVPSPPSPPTAFVFGSDYSARAAFLRSEHDLQPAPLRASPPVAPDVRIALPVIAPAPVIPTPDPPAAAVALPQPVHESRRRSASTDCTSIIEKAQLGELIEEDRRFLQDRCR